MKLTYEEILNNPSLLERLEQEARRARAEAVRELIVLPIQRLVADHAARPHLARQAEPCTTT